jgi:hypothetical protein
MRRKAALVGIIVVSACLASTWQGAAAASPPTFTAPVRADNPATGDGNSEPATIIDAHGRRYVANQLQSELAVTTNAGRTWRYPHGNTVLEQHVTGCTVDQEVGDVELQADRGGRVYFSTLGIEHGGTLDNGIQPLVGYSDDGFKTWHTTCAAHQPFMVDRQWLGTYQPPGMSSDHTRVYLTYHDFGPDQMWVNTSSDGGRTWGLPVDVIRSADALNSSMCDTVPGGMAVDQRNGWVYVSWTAGPNAANNVATGCNYSQGTIFNKLYVAVSKDGGATWTTSNALTMPDDTAAEPSDMSEIFTNVAVDRQGDVYVTAPGYFQHEYKIVYAWSKAADATGSLHFSAPTVASSPAVHTAYLPRLVAGDKGRLDLIYLGTPVRNVVSTPTNKTAYRGGGDGPNCSPEAIPGEAHGVRFLGKPCQLPDNARWYIYVAQTLDGTSPHPTWSQQRLRQDPMHYGDICTLGIFCLPGDNRDLADVNDIKIDPSGGFQVAYTWESKAKRNQIIFQCQTGGPGLYAGVKVRSCR